MAFAIYECTHCHRNSIEDDVIARAVGERCPRCREGQILPIQPRRDDAPAQGAEG